MVSKRGQAVLISLQNVPGLNPGQKGPVDLFEWRRPLRQRDGKNGVHQRAGSVLTIGALAQLGERLICIQEVNGSIPLGSTISRVGSSGG